MGPPMRDWKLEKVYRSTRNFNRNNSGKTLQNYTFRPIRIARTTASLTIKMNFEADLLS